MADIDTTTRTGLLVTFGHRIVHTQDEALMGLTDGMLIVTVTPTAEHPYFVRRYSDGSIQLKDSSSAWQSFNARWHLPAVIVFEPSTQQD